MFTKNNLKTNAVAEEVAKILEAEEMENSYGDTKPEDGPARKTIKGHAVNPKEYKDKLDKKYAKPSPYVGDVKEATEKPTHIVSKELLADHKRWMDSEGFDTHTVPLPKSHPKHATHVGIVAKNNNEAGYHEDGFARPIHESVDLEEGSGSKEKQKTPYRNINSPEYRAAANKQKEKMEKDDAASPGKKLLNRLKGGQTKLDKNHNGRLDAQDFKMLRGEKNESVEVDEAAKWRQGYSASGHPPGYKHKSGETGPLGGTYTNEPSGYDGETSKSPVNKYRDAADPLASRDKTKLSTTGKELLARNATKNLKAAITRSKGTHGPVNKLPEEVEIDEADNLTLRGLHTANPQSIPSYMRSTEKGKKSLADRNKPILKQLIKRQLGKHPKPNLPEEVEEIDEVSYSAKAAKAGKDIGKPGKMFSKIASSAAKRYGSKESGERVAGAVLAKLRKEDLDEELKGDMHPDAEKVLKHIKPEFHSTYKPFLKKGMYKGNYADRAAVLSAAEKAGHTLNEKKGDSDLGTFTDNNMGEMTDAQMKDRERIVKSMKKNLAGFKERYGNRAKNVMYATATKQAMKDEAIDPNVKTTDTLAGRIKGGDENQHTSYKVKLKTEAMGCENTPMSRATNLAKAAYKKLKNETMMGKAGATSEEKE